MTSLQPHDAQPTRQRALLVAGLVLLVVALYGLLLWWRTGSTDRHGGMWGLIGSLWTAPSGVLILVAAQRRVPAPMRWVLGLAGILWFALYPFLWAPIWQHLL
jgi:peptidoglycan/LPS O-acetylase OafA/YrhL